MPSGQNCVANFSAIFDFSIKKNCDLHALLAASMMNTIAIISDSLKSLHHYDSYVSLQESGG